MLVVEGAELSLGMCALGGCTTPENKGFGAALLMLSMLCLVGGTLIALRLGSPHHRVVRGLVALPTAAVLGLICLGVSLPDSAAGQNIAIFLMVVAFATTLSGVVDPRWAIGAILGALAAAAFGTSTWAGLLAAVAVFVTAGAFPSPSTRSVDQAT